MKASVMLDRGSRYEVLTVADSGEGIGTKNISVLLLHKVTETGSPFIVVAGYYLNEVGAFDSSVLAEIETVPESDYSWLKDLIRSSKSKTEEGSRNYKRIPITFW
ncbi:MAG TPA: hypothetical protein VFF30_11105 [Nitrososphaerales archaeon]|nr:hypothetical protein [Nitrososphaerales archaeon]